MAWIVGGLVSCTSFAAIDVMPKEIAVEEKGTTVQIVNNGSRPEYVNISLARLLNPGVPLEDEKIEQVGDANKPSLYAYPFKFSLAPRQIKNIVLKPLRPVETETVYRLLIKPVIKASSEGEQKTTGSVVVNLGFSALVRQLPADERQTLSVTCDTSGAQLTATGSVRYQVKAAKVDGQILDYFNVYPNVPIHIPGRVVEIPDHQTCRRSMALVTRLCSGNMPENCRQERRDGCRHVSQAHMQTATSRSNSAILWIRGNGVQ